MAKYLDSGKGTVEVCFPDKRRVFLPAIFLVSYRIADSERNKNLAQNTVLSNGQFPWIQTISQSSTSCKPNTPQPDGVLVFPVRIPLTLYIHFAQGVAIRSPEAAIKLQQQRKKVKKLDNGDAWEPARLQSIYAQRETTHAKS